MNTKYNSLLLLTILLAYLLSSCNEENIIDSKSDFVYAIPEEIGDGWKTASLSSMGMDVERIELLLNRIKSEYYKEVHSVVVVKNDKLVLEEYFEGKKFNLAQYTEEIGFDRNDTHNLCSATKSFVSALVGIAIEKGFIQSVDQKLSEFFPEHKDLFQNNPSKNSITIEHLLTMSSGIAWDDETYSYFDSRNDIYQLFNVSDPIRYILSKEIIEVPGTVFAYRNCNTNLLGEIIRKATDIRIDYFAQDYLFNKLGITEFEWQMLRNGVVFCSGDLRLRPRDMAKVGQLFLNKGTWKQERVISDNWINKSVKPHFAMPVYWWEDGYGYQWWIKTFELSNKKYLSYFAQGWGGQFIFIFPEINMIVVFTGGNYVNDPPNDEIMSNYILPALN